MRNVIYCLAVLLIIYYCGEIAGREPARRSKDVVNAWSDQPGDPPDELRVGRDEAKNMRGRRGKDDAAVKIAVKDLQALITEAPMENDSFVLYFVNYDIKSKKEKDRYLRKRPNADWESIGRKPSTVLVGFIGGGDANTMHLGRKMPPKVIPVYDIGLVCPPPPNCGCEIAQ